jgi:hypothetical protein
MLRIGLEGPSAPAWAHSLVDANRVADEIGTFPAYYPPGIHAWAAWAAGLPITVDELDEIAARWILDTVASQ